MPARVGPPPGAVSPLVPEARNHARCVSRQMPEAGAAAEELLGSIPGDLFAGVVTNGYREQARQGREPPSVRGRWVPSAHPRGREPGDHYELLGEPFGLVLHAAIKIRGRSRDRVRSTACTS